MVHLQTPSINSIHQELYCPTLTPYCSREQILSKPWTGSLFRDAPNAKVVLLTYKALWNSLTHPDTSMTTYLVLMFFFSSSFLSVFEWKCYTIKSYYHYDFISKILFGTFANKSLLAAWFLIFFFFLRLCVDNSDAGAGAACGAGEGGHGCPSDASRQRRQIWNRDNLLHPGLCQRAGRNLHICAIPESLTISVGAGWERCYTRQENSCWLFLATVSCTAGKTQQYF